MKPKSTNNYSAYAKYSGMAIQMAIIITLGTFGGLKLDEYLTLQFPIFTLILSVSSVVIAVYLAIKDIIRFNK
jgi:hypothetical protein